jgi:hypothetical protein
VLIGPPKVQSSVAKHPDKQPVAAPDVERAVSMEPRQPRKNGEYLCEALVPPHDASISKGKCRRVCLVEPIRGACGDERTIVTDLVTAFMAPQHDMLECYLGAGPADGTRGSERCDGGIHDFTPRTRRYAAAVSAALRSQEKALRRRLPRARSCSR